MKRILSIILTFLFLIACQQEYQPRNITEIAITAFKIDSTSIRAIQIVDTSSVFYAGSNGTIGHTLNNGALWVLFIIFVEYSVTRASEGEILKKYTRR